MPLKNGNTVALERRMDLASLFCMIGRHGPAVALAVIAMVSVLAGFIIYRTVRGKRRKAGAGAGDGDGGRSPGADRDASEPSPEESRSSTDVSDEGSSDVKDDADLIPSDLKIRHRRAAAEKKPPLYHPPTSDSVPDNKRNTSAVQDCCKVEEMYAEEASRSLHGDTHTAAEMDVEDDADCHQGSTDDTGKDAEEDRDNDSCLKPELFSTESHEEKVPQAEHQEEKKVTTDVDVSDERASQEEEKLQCVSNSPVCFDENGDDDKLQHNETTPDTNSTESNLDEPVVHIEDAPDSSIWYSKDADFEEVNHHPESVDHSDCPTDSSNHLSPEEETKNEGDEAEEECVDEQLIAQQAEIVCSAFEQEAKLPSSQQDQCDDVTEEVMLSVQSSDQDDDCGVTGEAIKGEIDEDHLNSLTDVRFDNHSLEFDKQQLQTEQKDENGEEDGVEKEKMLTSDDTDSRGEEHDSSSVVHDPAVPCLNPPLEPERIANGDEGVCGPTTDAKAQTSGIVDSPDSSPQSEVKEDADLNILDPDMPSLMEEIQSEMNETGTDVAEESVDHLVSSSYKDQQSDCSENIKTQDETSVNPASDAAVCDEASFTAPVTSTEISHPDVLSSFQDSDQMQNDADFPEVATGAAPDTTETVKPPVRHIHLQSFEQSELTWSSSGLGGESGISSMAVSPDLQDTADEFDIIPESVVLSVMQCDPQFGEQTEAQNSLFGDDAAISLINEDAAGAVFESCPSHVSQQPQSELPDWANDKSFAANEDMFGHEVEDSYHRAMDRFVTQFAANATSLTDAPKKQTEIKAAVEVGEMKKKEGAEKEEEEDYEKTEISIMEATMDHNEWITDGNYQVLPWMNLSVPSFATQDHAKADPLPSEEHRHSSSLPEVTCTDTDIPASTEVEQTNTLSLVDENTENNKKVVAVQPMPQNVNVTFRIHYLTHSPYQKVAITGNQQELGNWKGFIPLEKAKDGLWTTVVSLPAESHVEWKFVVVDQGEVCRWEECGNRLLDTGYSDDLDVHKWWGFL